MALKNKSGQTAAEAYHPDPDNQEPQNSEEKELGEIFADFENQLGKLATKAQETKNDIRSLNDKLSQVTEKIDAIGDPSPSPAFLDNLSIDKPVIIATLIILIAIAGFCWYQNSILHEIEENETRTNSILVNEKVFWYDEKSQKLYLDSREKIQHYQETQH